MTGLLTTDDALDKFEDDSMGNISIREELQ